jgi:hypothetical protein
LEAPSSTALLDLGIPAAELEADLNLPALGDIGYRMYWFSTEREWRRKREEQCWIGGALEKHEEEDDVGIYG